jgi:cell division septation protein DedD
LVMFLAGLVVGAILSTIYFGYTSGQIGVGTGLKNLTQNFEPPRGKPTSAVRDAGAAAAGASQDHLDQTTSVQSETAPMPAAEQPAVAAGSDDDQFDFYTELQSDTMLSATRNSTLGAQPANLPNTATMPAAPITPDMGDDGQRSADGALAANQPPPSEVTSIPVTPEATATASDNNSDGEPAAIAKTGLTRQGQFFMLQFATFSNFAAADKLKAQLALRGVHAWIQRTNESGGQYRVMKGPIIHYEQLDVAERTARELGLAPKRTLKKRDQG